MSWKCGDKVETTFGTLKQAQNEAYAEGIDEAFQFLAKRGLREIGELMISEVSLELYEMPICECKNHYFGDYEEDTK